jgi:hypothetical protein
MEFFFLEYFFWWGIFQILLHPFLAKIWVGPLVYSKYNPLKDDHGCKICDIETKFAHSQLLESIMCPNILS